METHLPYALNTASRDLDETKIDTLGPFSLALTFAVGETELSYR